MFYLSFPALRMLDWLPDMFVPLIYTQDSLPYAAVLGSLKEHNPLV